jgi:hypothetical protein
MPRQAERKKKEEAQKERNKKRRQKRQEEKESNDPQARRKIGRTRDARRVPDANARSAWPGSRLSKKTEKGKPRARTSWAEDGIIYYN